MKSKLTKKLNSLGYILVSTRFGISGDWLIVDREGNGQYFTTLGRVRLFVESLEK